MSSSRGVFFGWRVVGAAFVGLMVGVPAVLIFTLGVFTKPIEAEFDWTRTQVSLAATVYTLVSMVLAPFQGVLLDRVGPRRVVLVSTPFFGAALAALYFVPKSLPAYLGLWAVITFFGCGIFNTTWNKAVAAWFDRRLGLAIGIAVTGQGIGAAILPVVSQKLIGEFGWRSAYAALALLSSVAILIVSALCLYDRPSVKGLTVDGVPESEATAASAAVGFELRDAVRTRTFKLSAIAFGLLGMMTSAMMTHQVPMLVDAGRTPERAAAVQGVFGLAIILGRVTVGTLLDRFFAPRVLVASLIGVVIGLALYATGARGDAAFIAAPLIGFGLGAEIDVLGYFIPRYFGRRAYGKIYGAILAAFQLGAAIGAAMLAIIRTKTGDYTNGLFVITAGTVIAIGLLLRLEKFPDASTFKA